jgi:FkbM family methyltransferase
MSDLLKDDYNLAVIVTVKPKGDDFFISLTPRFSSTYENGYEYLSSRLFKSRICNSNLLIDVGANYGYYSLLALSTNPKIEVEAFEPILENVQVLYGNIKNYKEFSDRIRIHQKALDSTSAEKYFFKSKASDNSSFFIHPNAGPIDRIKISTIRGDELEYLQKYNNIFLKIDTDGNEMEVLKGLELTIRKCDSIQLLIEFNPKMFLRAGHSSEDLFNFLVDRGFYLYAIDDEDSIVYPLQMKNLNYLELKFSRSYFNVYATKYLTKNLLFFSHTSELGGAERSLLDLIKGLSKEGVICNCVLPYKGGPLKEKLLEIGCGVIELDISLDSWWWCGVSRENSFKDPRMISYVHDKLIPIVAKIMPDFIYSQTIVSPWGAYCAEALGIKHIISAREYGALDHNLQFPIQFETSMRSLYESSCGVLSITSDVASTLFGRDDHQKVEVVYNQLSVSDFVRKNEVIQLPKDRFKIGIFGTFHKGKGQDEFIQACQVLLNEGYNVECYLVGGQSNTNYTNRLKTLISEYEFKERFYLLEFQDDPYSFMAQMSVIVSCSRLEALGRTLFEASLLSIPIVYANSGGPKEVFQDGTHGLAYPPGDYKALARCLEKLYLDRDLCDLLSKNAKDYVINNFSEKVGTKKVINKLNHLINLNVNDKKPLTHLLSNYFSTLALNYTFNISFNIINLNNEISREVIISGIGFGKFNLKVNEQSTELRICFDTTRPIGFKILSLIKINEDGQDEIQFDRNLKSNYFFDNGYWFILDGKSNVSVSLNTRESDIAVKFETILLSQYQIAQISKSLQEQNQNLQEQNQNLQEQNQNLQEQNQNLQEQYQQLFLQNQNLLFCNNSLLSSKSWRFITIVRKPFDYFKKLFKY